MNNKHLSLRYISLFRRFPAFIAENCFYWAYIALCFQIYPDQYDYYLGGEETWVVEAIEYSVLPIFLLDQLLLPVIYGRTFITWIFGYQIQTRQGANPAFWQALLRALAFIIEWFSLGLISLVTALIRSDRATVHDLLSGTRAVHPVNGTPARKTRIASIFVAIWLMLLYIIVSVNYIVYDDVIVPAEIEAEEAGLFPEQMQASKLSSELWTIGRLGLFEQNKFKQLNACRKYKKSTHGNAYTLTIGNRPVEMTVVKTKEKVVFKYLKSSGYSGKEKDKSFEDWIIDPIVAAGLYVAENYPFLMKNHELATWVSRYDDPQFSLFSPMKNTDYIVAKFNFMIMFPGLRKDYEQSLFSVLGPDYYVFASFESNEDLVYLESYVVQDDHVWRVYITAKEPSAKIDQIVYEMIGVIRPMKEKGSPIQSRSIDTPMCQ